MKTITTLAHYKGNRGETCCTANRSIRRPLYTEQERERGCVCVCGYVCQYGSLDNSIPAGIGGQGGGGGGGGSAVIPGTLCRFVPISGGKPHSISLHAPV